MFCRYGLLLPKKGQNKVQIKSVFGDDSDDVSTLLKEQPVFRGHYHPLFIYTV